MYSRGCLELWLEDINVILHVMSIEIPTNTCIMKNVYVHVPVHESLLKPRDVRLLCHCLSLLYTISLKPTYSDYLRRIFRQRDTGNLKPPPQYSIRAAPSGAASCASYYAFSNVSTCITSSSCVRLPTTTILSEISPRRSESR